MLQTPAALLVINVTPTLGPGATSSIVASLQSELKRQKIRNYWVALSNPNQVEINSERFSLNARKPPLTSIYSLRSTVKELAKDGKNWVIVHSHLSWAFYVAFFACLGLDVKLVHTEHNSYNKRRGIRLIRWLEGWVYRRHSRVFAISLGVKEELAKWIGISEEEEGLIEVIENGTLLYERKKTKRALGGPLNVVSLARLERQKGIDLAIDAIAMSGEMVNEYRIYGDGSLRQELTDKVSGHELGYKIRLLGRTNDVATALNWADVVLMPSRWEGFGLVAVEAMSSGLPLIASRVPGLSGVIGEENPGVYWLESITPVEIAAGLRFFFERQASLQEMTTFSVSRAQKYSLQRMVEKYVLAYKSVSA